jgi:aminopeptidase N
VGPSPRSYGLAFARVVSALTLVVSCTDDAGAPDESAPESPSFVGTFGALLPALPDPSADPGRDILSTAIDLDLAAMTARATIQVAASPGEGLSFEIGDLEVEAVSHDDLPLKFQVVDAELDGGVASSRRLDIGVPSGSEPVTIVVAYRFKVHDALDGWSPASGLTFLWPYFCANLFPCHSRPDDGSTFALHVNGVPPGKTAIFPPQIPSAAPSYMLAIAVGDYAYTALGTTSRGTKIGFYALPPEVGGGVVAATEKLVDFVDWYETTLGPYMFGDEMAAVDVKWPPTAYGGMEHHPYFHVADHSIDKEYVHAHEAAHGWFGDGVRIKCWEDFVLSEGTVTYLAARATEVVRGAPIASALWTTYRTQLDAAVAAHDTEAWPSTCDAIDILNHPLKSTIPYMKGAFFYKKVADTIGAPALDVILAKFYQQNQGNAASMGDMLAMIRDESGFDPSALATRYLQSLGNPEL